MKNKRSQGILWVAAILPPCYHKPVDCPADAVRAADGPSRRELSEIQRAIFCALPGDRPFDGCCYADYIGRVPAARHSQCLCDGAADGCSAYDGDWQHDAQVSADVVLRHQKCLDTFQRAGLDTDTPARRTAVFCSRCGYGCRRVFSAACGICPDGDGYSGGHACGNSYELCLVPAGTGRIKRRGRCSLSFCVCSMCLPSKGWSHAAV